MKSNGYTFEGEILIKRPFKVTVYEEDIERAEELAMKQIEDYENNPEIFDLFQESVDSVTTVEVYPDN